MGEVDILAIRGGAAARSSAVPFAEELTAFADAIARRDPRAIEASRDRLEAAAGPEVVVDAAGVAANFQRMARIADATGIPVDRPIRVASTSLRETLGLDRFATAANTGSQTTLGRFLAKLVAPIMLRLLPYVSRRRDEEA